VRLAPIRCSAQVPGVGHRDPEVTRKQRHADILKRVLGPAQSFDQHQGRHQQPEAQQVLEQVLLEGRQRVAGAPEQHDGQRPDQRAAQREELAPADQRGLSTAVADRIPTGARGRSTSSGEPWASVLRGHGRAGVLLRLCALGCVGITGSVSGWDEAL
jgi:hypothetical protein